MFSLFKTLSIGIANVNGCVIDIFSKVMSRILPSAMFHVGSSSDVCNCPFMPFKVLDT